VFSSNAPFDDQFAAHALDGSRKIAKAANTAWISDIAGAASGFDVASYTLYRVAAAGSRELIPNCAFGFSKAVAHRTITDRLLLRDADTDVRSFVRGACFVVVHDAACRRSAESVAHALDSAQSRFRQDRLYGTQFYA